MIFIFAGSFAAKISINQNITGLLGKKGTHITCSFSLEKGETIYSVQIMAETITEDFDKKNNIIAEFIPMKVSELKSPGKYLDGRVALTNITNTSNKASLKFHILNWTDDKHYMCELYYTDMENTIRHVKSNACRISIKGKSFR